MFPDLMLKKRAAVMNNRNKDVVIVAAFVQLQIMGCRGENIDFERMGLEFNRKVTLKK